MPTLYDYIIGAIRKDDIRLYDDYAGIETTIVGNKIVSVIDHDEEWFDLDEIYFDFDLKREIARVKYKRDNSEVPGNNGECFWFGVQVRKTNG